MDVIDFNPLFRTDLFKNITVQNSLQSDDSNNKTNVNSVQKL